VSSVPSAFLSFSSRRGHLTGDPGCLAAAYCLRQDLEHYFRHSPRHFRKHTDAFFATGSDTCIGTVGESMGDSLGEAL
jgi:hypothetical protein